MKILIVEDDKSILQAITAGLEGYYDITTSMDGEDGLYLAEQNIYDAIILDIMLPQLKGDEVLKTLRKDGVDTPVLFLTAKDSLEDKLKGFKLGADDYIIKPFHLEELKVRVDALLRRFGTLSDENILRYETIEFNMRTKELYIKGENDTDCFMFCSDTFALMG
jgi:two-component system, OmpR family, response regulator CiaR